MVSKLVTILAVILLLFSLVNLGIVLKATMPAQSDTSTNEGKVMVTVVEPINPEPVAVTGKVVVNVVG